MPVLLCGPGLMAHSGFDCAAPGRFRVLSSAAGKCSLGEPAKVHVEWRSPCPARPANAVQHLPSEAHAAVPERQTFLRRPVLRLAELEELSAPPAARAGGQSAAGCGGRGAAGGGRTSGCPPGLPAPCPPGAAAVQAPATSAAGGVTTVMLRHVPEAVTQEGLLLELDRAGFALEYDFVHLRSDLRSRFSSDRGMAFVNFLTPQVAGAFSEAFHGAREVGGHALEAGCLEVLPAKIQGFALNAAQHYPSASAARRGFQRARPVFLPKTADAHAQLRSLMRRRPLQPRTLAHQGRPRSAGEGA
ncbi:unnamed protein product [Prorocentrum cordatum]|uniref:Mei2-like C-terminal RNA recognition motif domain-containing protein n=1 Tax=Prorocentrum cordatum TaxID=2364126 RepID=A0ABN9X6F4_9DINO|nr:unnamed protein product [Polarella glacialis]